MRRVALTVNGTRHELELEPRELLVYVLRERLGLTGTNVGCDTSACGACTVARWCPSYGAGPTDPDAAALLVKTQGPA